MAALDAFAPLAPAAVVDDAAGRPPERRCIVTGEVASAARLLRFVVSPADEILCDVTGRLPGRGLWVRADRSILAEAIRRNAFRRAARRPVRVADDLLARVEQQVLDRALDLVGLARRAGQAVFGFERVREWLLAGQAGVLLAAVDGDPRDRARLRQIAGEVTVIAALTADEMGRATGRPRTVHGAVAPGRLARAILDETNRLAHLRPSGTDEEAGASDRTAAKWRT